MIEIPENILFGLLGALSVALIRVGVSEKLKKLDIIATKNKEDIIRIKAIIKDYNDS